MNKIGQTRTHAYDGVDFEKKNQFFENRISKSIPASSFTPAWSFSGEEVVVKSGVLVGYLSPNFRRWWKPKGGPLEIDFFIERG